MIKFSVLFLLFISCIENREEIAPEYRALLNNYTLNEVIVFQNSQQDKDSIRVVNIDSIYSSQGPSNLPFKEITVEIEHLPVNSWDNGIVRDNKRTFQGLISVFREQTSRRPEDDKYIVSINYQDFIGTLNTTKLSNTINDTIVIMGDEKNIISDDSVVKLFWHKQKGLCGYKLQNGELFWLID